MIDDVLQEANERMYKTLEALRGELNSIRTGRASPSLIDRLQVDYFGTPTPLQQLSTISVPDAQTLLIRPYSQGDMAAIEKAILASDLGLTPNNDGKNIRLVFPSLTQDRRRELAKVVSKRAEDSRVAVRNIRRDAINDLRSFQKESMISEDDLHRGQELVQERTDEFIKRIDETAKEKEQEIMTL